MRVAIVGASGQLGRDAVDAFAAGGDEVLTLGHADIEVCSEDSVFNKIRELSPQLIVNTSALHDVEKCERDPGLAFTTNALGPRNLAVAAREVGAILMHVSTDYVFDGSQRKPYTEADLPIPLNVYGISKLAGEHIVRSTVDRHFILRTSGLYGHQPCRGKGGLNFVELMLKLGDQRGKVRVVDSEHVTPTSTFELARQMVLLSRSKDFGLYHATAEGSCTWHQFAKKIFLLSGASVQVDVAQPGEFPSKVPRPSYSVLENERLKALGLNGMRSWEEGLQRYLEHRPATLSHSVAG